MLPSIAMPRNRWPLATLHIIVDADYAPLIRLLAPGAEVHGVPRSQTIAGLWQAVRGVRRLKADLACSLSPARRNAALTLCSGARAVAGYLTAADGPIHYLARTPVESFGVALQSSEIYGREHIAERSLKVWRALGARDTRAQTSVCEQKALDRASECLKQTGRVPQGRYVVIHPFASWKYKRWALPRFIALAWRIGAELGCPVVFLSNAIEGRELAPFQRRFEKLPTMRFVSTDDLIEMAAVIRNARLFIGNDSGPLHLAAALAVPILGLYGPADPALTAPVRVSATLIYKAAECSPCSQQVCVRPADHCLNRTSVREVFAAAGELLQRFAPKEAATV